MCLFICCWQKSQETRFKGQNLQEFIVICLTFIMIIILQQIIMHCNAIKRIKTKPTEIYSSLSNLNNNYDIAANHYALQCNKKDKNKYLI